MGVFMVKEASSNEKLPESELCVPCLRAGFETKATKIRNGGIRLCDDCDLDYKITMYGLMP